MSSPQDSYGAHGYSGVFNTIGAGVRHRHLQNQSLRTAGAVTPTPDTRAPITAPVPGPFTTPTSMPAELEPSSPPAIQEPDSPSATSPVSVSPTPSMNTPLHPNLLTASRSPSQRDLNQMSSQNSQRVRRTQSAGNHIPSNSHRLHHANGSMNTRIGSASGSSSTPASLGSNLPSPNILRRVSVPGTATHRVENLTRQVLPRERGG